ncbi:MAG TPA: flagellar hook-basal body complex protein [Magnetospirillum sp.]|nr:flagellar hook-basal body complex protein [Magnetospirillum sp.]
MLWGAFNNASTAMQVFTTDLGSISQNIANVNTTGYKRQEMMFSTMMSEGHAAPNTYLGGLNIFGVQATQRNLIDAQGTITPSTTWSDLAINGKGFFMVGTPTPGAAASTTGAGASSSNVPTTIDTENPQSVMYTRDGAWHRAYGPDTDTTLARSYFLNGQGGYLLGWMADNTGAIPKDAPLQPVYTLAPKPIANNGTAAVDPTSTLTPSTVTMPGRQTTEATILANLPSDSKIGGRQTTLKVDDGKTPPGQQTVTLDWDRTGANTYRVTASTQHASLSTSSWDVTVSDTGEVISPTAAQNVDFTWDAAAGGTTTSRSLSLLSPPPRGVTQTITMNVYDNNFTGHEVDLRFERIGTNKWYMFTDPGEDATAGSEPDPIMVQFDDNGKIVTPAGGAVDFGFKWDAQPASGTKAAVPAGSGTVSVDLTGLSQYNSSDLYIRNVSTDGYGRGTLLQTAFSDTGELNGYYDNGQSRTLFKVPVATFVSENALEPVSGTMFRRSESAGALTVSAVEDVPGGGAMVTSSLEGSTVDIEDEFTRMIMTQKAYSTNAQVFKTADEMTTTARDLKG